MSLTATDASVAKRKRQTTLGTFLAMDQTIIEALAEVLSRRILPIDFTLDFMWLLFTKSASAINIDGFVSLPFAICELRAYALAAQAVFHTIPFVSELTRRYA